jgi:hypothetical protein
MRDARIGGSRRPPQLFEPQRTGRLAGQDARVVQREALAVIPRLRLAVAQRELGLSGRATRAGRILVDR